jgi:hypothetical protein
MENLITTLFAEAIKFVMDIAIHNPMVCLFFGVAIAAGGCNCKNY